MFIYFILIWKYQIYWKFSLIRNIFLFGLKKILRRSYFSNKMQWNYLSFWLFFYDPYGKIWPLRYELNGLMQIFNSNVDFLHRRADRGQFYIIFDKFKLPQWFSNYWLFWHRYYQKMSDGAAPNFVDEFFSVQKSYKVCFVFSLIAWFLQLLALGTQNWFNVKNNSVGLWIHCNYTVKDFICCQPLDDFLRHSYSIYRFPGKYKFTYSFFKSHKESIIHAAYITVSFNFF